MSEFYVYVIYRDRWIDYIGFGTPDRVLQQIRLNPHGRVAVVYKSNNRRDAYEYEQNLIRKHMPSNNKGFCEVPYRNTNLDEIEVTLVPTKRYKTVNISDDVYEGWKQFCENNGLFINKATDELLRCAINGTIEGSFVKPYLERKGQ